MLLSIITLSDSVEFYQNQNHSFSGCLQVSYVFLKSQTCIQFKVRSNVSRTIASASWQAIAVVRQLVVFVQVSRSFVVCLVRFCILPFVYPSILLSISMSAFMRQQQ